MKFINFIELTKIYDNRFDAQIYKILIDASLIRSAEDTEQGTLINLDGDKFFVTESLEEIKAILGVKND